MSKRVPVYLSKKELAIIYAAIYSRHLENARTKTSEVLLAKLEEQLEQFNEE